MTEKTYDVAIIGYGPTGATAANLLGRLGLDVLVVERDRDIYRRARAISTDEEVLRVWQSVGLADRLQRDMLPDRPIAFVDAAGAPFIETTITGRGCGHPAQQFLYQPAVDRVLRAGVTRFSNVEVLLEHEVTQVVNHAGHVMLTLAAAQSCPRVRARYVIAADGGSSPTRTMLGVGYSGTTSTERWVVIDTKVLREWDTHDRLRFHCNPARPTVDCPTPLGHHRWEFPARADENAATLVSHDAVWNVLHEQGITEHDVEILRAVVYSHHVRVADRWRIGRVFLAGDAAHAMPPWIGQGMSAGVRDVANLCWKIAAVLRGQISESLLDSYETERKPHVIEVTRRAVLVGRVITERRRFVAALRNHTLRALTRLPGVLAGGQRLYWIPEARYRDGFFARAGRHRSSRIRRRATGRQIPQPWVIDRHSGHTVRLDHVLAGRWVLLYRGDPPDGAHPWSAIAVPALQIGEDFDDHTGALTAWLRDMKAAAVVVRPDGFVYAAAGPGHRLPAPPCGPNDSIRMLTREAVSA